MLMAPKSFAQEAAGPVPSDRVSDFFAGHHAQFGLGALRELVPVSDEATEHQTLALIAQPREIAVLRQPRSATEA